MRITILGCGPSGGVPLITGNWGDCDPHNPKNRRRRSSLLIQTEVRQQGSLCKTLPKNLLIDMGPDFREQWLSVSSPKLDAVLCTHDHADHTHGIDDLRQIYFETREPIPLYSNENTLNSLQKRFSYLFKEMPPLNSTLPPVMGSLPFFKSCPIEGAFWAEGVPAYAFLQDHGFSETLGYRLGTMAYSTDVVTLSDSALSALEGLDLWIVDALRRDERPTHAHLSRTLQWIEKVKPKRAILTHMDYSMDYETLRAELPGGVEPAYDGMVITL